MRVAGSVCVCGGGGGVPLPVTFLLVSLVHRPRYSSSSSEHSGTRHPATTSVLDGGGHGGSWRYKLSISWLISSAAAVSHS